MLVRMRKTLTLQRPKLNAASRLNAQPAVCGGWTCGARGSIEIRDDPQPGERPCRCRCEVGAYGPRCDSQVVPVETCPLKE